MKLKDLITKLQGKPNQEADVYFVVFESAKDGNIVCIDLAGPTTKDIMRVLYKDAKRK